MPKITKPLIDATPAPATGDTWIWDTELQGFGVRIQPSGRRTYTLRYRARDAERTQRKMVLCRCSDATPAKARDLARDVLMRVAVGQDPAAERRPSRQAGPTVEAMFKARVAAMAAAGRTNADEVERVLLKAANNAADAFGRDTKPADVTPADVVKYVSTFYQAGHRAAADKARGYIAAAYSWAIKSANDYTVATRADWGVTANPAAAVAKDHGATAVRDRNLSAAELKALWDDMGTFDRDVEACLRTMVACGQRVQETLRMAGRELDLAAATWTIPAEKTKGRRRDHVVPLPAIIVPHLAALKAERGDGDLFAIEAVDVSQAVRRYVNRKGAPVAAFQPRDLRRTWKSRSHDAGVDRFTRDLIQQHAMSSDTGSKHYDRADYSIQMRAAMDKWNAWLTAALGDPPRVLALAA